MEILFVSTELAPYVKVGGLADVVAALPKALRALGQKVTIVMPRYSAFEHSGVLAARRLTPMRFKLGSKDWEVTLFDARLPTQVDLILVDAPGLFDRDGGTAPGSAASGSGARSEGRIGLQQRGVYGDGAEDYPDNATRFAILSRAAAQIAKERCAAGTPFDVVHCHDWPTALVPTYLRELAAEVPALAATKTVLTIHNLAYQGTFAKDVLPALGLSWEAFSIDGIEFYGGVNILKQGILTADAVTTVSATYAREILAPAHGCKLDGVLRELPRPVAGITNGVDYASWNPATDPALAGRFDAEDRANKARCKGALQKELGLAIDAEAPLIANVGRIVHQKGSDLVAGAIVKLLRATDAQIVVAGDGDPSLVGALDAAIAKGPGRAVFAHDGHEGKSASEALVHRIFAAADFVLVPSRFEPCGLVQMYAQRYGALPIGRATGGLVDTIVDCDAKLETGTGFLFDEESEEALVGAVERAIAARRSPRWPSLVRRVMRLDRGWERPARQYEQLYRSLAR